MRCLKFFDEGRSFCSARPVAAAYRHARRGPLVPRRPHPLRYRHDGLRAALVLAAGGVQRRLRRAMSNEPSVGNGRAANERAKEEVSEQSQDLHMTHEDR